MTYTYKIEYCDAKNEASKGVTFNVNAVNLSTAIAKAARKATLDNAVVNYTFVSINNTNNSGKLFDQNNESATFDLSDIAND